TPCRSSIRSRATFRARCRVAHARGAPRRPTSHPTPTTHYLATPARAGERSPLQQSASRFLSSGLKNGAQHLAKAAVVAELDAQPRAWARHVERSDDLGHATERAARDDGALIAFGTAGHVAYGHAVRELCLDDAVDPPRQGREDLDVRVASSCR